MMDGQLLVTILSGFFIACGVVALLIGSLGLLRLPDVYCRIHAVGMMDTAGASFIILGIALHGFIMERPEFVDIALLYAILNFIGTFAVLKLFSTGSLGDAPPSRKE